ncbi:MULTISPECIES: hypothetical protein [Corynebacterium]|nr:MULTISPECIES: hypothetical protein [Corynebacterium]AIK85043.1 hypothetical protein CGLAR1_07205 [Corynebacterium glutamicum]AIK87827.1 hypothetical protein AR0_07340 [Corynebacterium glutamicum]AUI00886.1 hypothetical protein CYL77_06900 [Corynebacterium glutamicum]AUI04531.1 hypothetical protein C0I99_10595 [Corynebacterium glutamicum]KEI23091.1 hypothetical protein KIQ_011100 [Corynebacterium glutamicum ATCC 14067]
MRTLLSKASALHVVTVIGALALIVIILWIDISTGFWQEIVILSGLAAGLVTFCSRRYLLVDFTSAALKNVGRQSPTWP